MKKIVLIALALILVSVLCVNAEIIKKPTLWGFGMRLTGKAVTVLPIPPSACPSSFSFTNNENLQYSFDIKVMPGQVNIGPENKNLHFYESNNQNLKPIALNEYFVLTKKSAPQFTHVLRYTGINTAQRKLTFQDLSTGTREITYSPTGEGSLVVSGIVYRVYVNTANEHIAVDQNADNLLNGEQAVIVGNDAKTYNQEFFTGNRECNPQITCTDSDRSSNYDLTIYSGAGLTLASRPDVFTPGNITFIPPGKVALVVKDECFNDVHMSEAYCQEDKYQGRQGITCPNGCENGACKSQGGIGIMQNECTGLEMVWPDINRRRNYTYALDMCNKYRCLVGKEIGASCKSKSSCAQSCTGTCVSITEMKQKCPRCRDSDGLNYDVKGSVTGALASFPDSPRDDICISDTELREMFCNAQGLGEPRLYTCPNGCADGVCVQHVRELGPPPIAPEFAVKETVTCLFALPTKTPVCTSAKGSCTGVLDGSGSSTCTVQVTGAQGETVTWTSDCGNDAKPAVTTINGQNENAGFVCTDINMPNLLPYHFPGSFI